MVEDEKRCIPVASVRRAAQILRYLGRPVGFPGETPDIVVAGPLPSPVIGELECSLPLATRRRAFRTSPARFSGAEGVSRWKPDPRYSARECHLPSCCGTRSSSRRCHPHRS